MREGSIWIDKGGEGQEEEVKEEEHCSAKVGDTPNGNIYTRGREKGWGKEPDWTEACAGWSGYLGVHRLALSGGARGEKYLESSG